LGTTMRRIYLDGLQADVDVFSIKTKVSINLFVKQEKKALTNKKKEWVGFHYDLYGKARRKNMIFY
jgi:hypothetical protein